MALPVANGPRCPKCWRRRGAGSPIAVTPCPDCSDTPLLNGGRSVYVFDRGTRTLVYGLKYHALSALARPMGRLMAEFLEHEPLPVDMVVPVPLHSRRRRERGFNQAELLGRVIAERNQIELDLHSLRRVRNTPKQMQVRNPHLRELNVRDAFRCDAVARRRILLVDDVLTTGATLRACAACLRQAGAASVWTLTFARAD